MEKWKFIDGYEAMYQVSTIGRIRSVEREYRTASNKLEHRKEVVLKPQEKRGYLQVALCKANKVRWHSVHRFVALAFLRKPSTMHFQVNHINGRKADNRIENLEWVTPRQNQDHALTHGLMKSKDKAVLCIQTNIVYKSINEAARQIRGKAYGICHVLSGRQKHYKGLSFKFSK